MLLKTPAISLLTGVQLNSCFRAGWEESRTTPPVPINTSSWAYSNPPVQPGDEDPLGSWRGSQRCPCSMLPPPQTCPRGTPCQGQGDGFPSVRWAFESALATENTFQATVLDTPSAYGSVHSPYKQPAGSRLARAALATAYGMPSTNPTVAEVQVEATDVVVKLAGLGSEGIELRSKTGFELLGADGVWHNAPLAGLSAPSKGSVRVPIPSGVAPTAVRYLWYDTPCGNQPYRCPVYAKTKALGSLSGELDFLPLGPFIRQLNSTTARSPRSKSDDNAAAATCPALTTHLPNTCFVAVSERVGAFAGLSESQCCAACSSAQAQGCTAYQWNHPGNHWGNINGTTDDNCFLYDKPSVKQPVHPMQSQCNSGTMPLPPPPPWPATPPAGAKNILYVLVDDLRTELESFHHGSMHTPHFSAFADTAMTFEQAHCNSQMCVPTRNSFMVGRRPDTTRVFNDGIGNRHFRIEGPGWTSMPQAFKEAGFFTTVRANALPSRLHSIVADRRVALCLPQGVGKSFRKSTSGCNHVLLHLPSC